MFPHLLLSMDSDIGRIGTQMLWHFGGIRSLYHHGLQRRFQQFHVVGVGAA
jgi:hypothetical protein